MSLALNRENTEVHSLLENVCKSSLCLNLALVFKFFHSLSYMTKLPSVRLSPSSRSHSPQAFASSVNIKVSSLSSSPPSSPLPLFSLPSLLLPSPHISSLSFWNDEWSFIKANTNKYLQIKYQLYHSLNTGSFTHGVSC